MGAEARASRLPVAVRVCCLCNVVPSKYEHNVCICGRGVAGVIAAAVRQHANIVRASGCATSELSDLACGQGRGDCVPVYDYERDGPYCTSTAYSRASCKALL